MLSDKLKAVARAYAAKCLGPDGTSRPLSCGACRRECLNLRRQAEQGGALDVARAFASGAVTMGMLAVQDRFTRTGARLKARLKPKNPAPPDATNLQRLAGEIEALVRAEGTSATVHAVTPATTEGTAEGTAGTIRIRGTPPKALSHAAVYKGVALVYD